MVSNILVRLRTVSDIGGAIIKWKQEKLREVIRKVLNKKFLQSHFLQDDHKGFLEDVEVRLIDKTKCSDPTK